MSAWGIKPAFAIACVCLSWSAPGFLGIRLPGQEVHSADSGAAVSSAADYQIEKNALVKMRDGVMLATDIYRPARQGNALAGRFPVIVYRTPYNKEGLRREGIFFAQHGYVVVAQDCRGRFGSGGAFGLLAHDGEDGYDIIEWAAIQPWSNGEIGTAGASYEAWTQYAAAMHAPPHLVAMFPVVGWDSFFRYALNGGVPSLSMSEWILFMAQTSQEAAAMPALRAQLEATFKNPAPWLRLPPAQRATLLHALPSYLGIFQDVYRNPAADSFWRQPNLDLEEGYARFKDVPMFFISGWYDGTVGGVIRNFVQLSARQTSQKMLLIGPWPHATGDSTCGEADFGPAAAVDEQALELDWFDHWLKGKPFQRIGSSPVTIFQMGGGIPGRSAQGKLQPGGQWLSLRSWPENPSRRKDFYLQPGNQLRGAPRQQANISSFVDDPSKPVPTSGGYLHGECVQNQEPLEKRMDVLSFTTPILTSDLAVTGEAQAQLWVSTSAPDTDFVVKVTDVYPNGYSMIVAEGEMRLSDRSGTDLSKPAVPHAIYSITIPMGPTSNLFQAGHRIRLDISSSDFPRLEPNSNTGAPLGQWTATVPARNSIYDGGEYPSRLVLPLLSASSMQRVAHGAAVHPAE